MKNRPRLFIACMTLLSGVFPLSVFAEIKESTHCEEDPLGTAFHDQVDASLQSAMGFFTETFDATGIFPSGEAIQQHLLAHEEGIRPEALREALDSMAEQTSLGNRIPVPTYRMLSLMLLTVSYYYPEVWPVTLLFLLDADWVISGWIQSYFDNGFVKVGLTGGYYAIVIQQFEQFQREFRHFLSKQGHHLQEYWMPLTGTLFAAYKYNERHRVL